VLLDRRVDGRLAAGDLLQGLADLRGTRVLGQVAAGPGPQRVDDRAVVGVRGQDQDLDAGVMVAQPAGGAVARAIAQRRPFTCPECGAAVETD
jgi:hypothetical protein